MGTLHDSVRPFGTSVIIASADKTGPSLHMVEPSGISYGYYGVAIGQGKQVAKTELENLNLQELTARQAAIEIAKIIYKIHDDVKDKDFELELSWVCAESNNKHQRIPEDLLAEANEAGKNPWKPNNLALTKKWNCKILFPFANKHSHFN